MPSFGTLEDAFEWLQAIQVVCKSRVKMRIAAIIAIAAVAIGTLIALAVLVPTNVIAYVIWLGLVITLGAVVVNILYPELRRYKYLFTTAAVLLDNKASLSEIYNFITKECFIEEE